jgi:hypothetical protein
MGEHGEAAVLRRLRAQVRAAEALARSWEAAVARGQPPEGFFFERDAAVAADHLRRALEIPRGLSRPDRPGICNVTGADSQPPARNGPRNDEADPH